MIHIDKRKRRMSNPPFQLNRVQKNGLYKRHIPTKTERFCTFYTFDSIFSLKSQQSAKKYGILRQITYSSS